MDAYYKVYQIDGRIENFHWNIESENILLDLILFVEKHALYILNITKEQFTSETTELIGRINVHMDLHEPNDAEGECIGYIEHYEL